VDRSSPADGGSSEHEPKPLFDASLAVKPNNVHRVWYDGKLSLEPTF
jgi:hypothetical protein